MIAPKLCTHMTPWPAMLYTKRPSPETTRCYQRLHLIWKAHKDLHNAFPRPWLFVERVIPIVHAKNASLPTRQFCDPSRWIGTISPQISGASRTSPGPVKIDSDIYTRRERESPAQRQR